MKRVPLLWLLLGCSGPGANKGVVDAAMDGTIADSWQVPIDAASQDDTSAADAHTDGDDGLADGSAGDVSADSALERIACPDSLDAGTTVECPSGACIDTNWAAWAMPNSPVDAVAGAPNRQSYTVNGDGTVTDDVTGLMWQQAQPANGYTWADAQAYCRGLVLGGRGDWRLATYIELISIVDYAHNIPSIDPTAFPAAAATEAWSSTSIASAPTSAWEVFFASGDTGDAPMAEALSPRCVRPSSPSASPPLPASRYTVNGATAYDTRTKLSWQRAAPAGAYTWAEAKGYCASLNLDGASTWRLPTAKELVTIADVTKTIAPAIDCATFPGALATRYWSATPFVGSTTWAWAVYFHLSFVTTLDVSSIGSVRCVR